MPEKKLSTDPSSRGVKTAQFLEQLYFTSGLEGVKATLAEEFASSTRMHWLSETGTPAYRTDIGDSERITYEIFSPPPLWHAPYTISLVRFRKPGTDPSEFIYHGSEELLLPVDGSLQYTFFHSRGCERPGLVRSRILTAHQVICRTNPLVPHATSAVTDEAIAWMVFRDAADATARLIRSKAPDVGEPDSLGERSGATGRHSDGQRIVTFSQLANPARYALVAWGLAQRIHDARLQSALSLEQLGDRVGMDRTSLSRLERGELNIRLDRLIAICKELHIDIAGAIESSEWCKDEKNLPEFRSRENPIPLFEHERRGHFLVPTLFDLSMGEKSKHDVMLGMEHSSWIVLRGRVILDLPASMGLKSVILNGRNVIHFRSRTGTEEVVMHAIEDSRLLAITVALDRTPLPKQEAS